MQTFKFLAGSLLIALLLLPALCSAQSVSIVSGDGQLICPDCAGGPYPYNLTVQVNGSTGAASPSTTVTWTVNQQGESPATGTSTTNSLGQATYSFLGTVPFFGNTIPATVTASALGASVTFVETTIGPGSGGGPGAEAALSTGSLPNIDGAVGTDAAPITVTVFSLGLSGALPNIAVQLIATGTGQAVSCAPVSGQPAGTPAGIVFTNSSGSATCTPVIGGKAGTGGYSLTVGGKFATWGPANLTVKSGSAAVIKTVTTTPETVNSGTKVSLVALVTDMGGNDSSGAEVTWSVTEGTATLSNTTSSSASNGDVNTTVTPTIGPVQVTAALNGTSAKVVFTINVNEIVNGLTYVSGNNQTALEKAAFAGPLVVMVDDGTIPVPGANVTFTVASGFATLSNNASGASGAAGTCTTSGNSCTVPAGTNGEAQVYVTAGSNYGAVAITASTIYAGATYSVPFTLTVNPPGPIVTSVVNAAGYAQAPTASPCGLVTVYGTGIAVGLQGVVSPLVAPQMQVAGVTVSFGTPASAAPILYVANINGTESLAAQVPCEVGIGTAVPMVVTANGVASPPFSVNVTQYSPGIFTFVDSDNVTRAVLVRSDGSVISATNPAHAGDILTMYATGLGQTTPPLMTNEFDPLILNSSDVWVPEVLPVDATIAVGVDNAGVLVLSQTYAINMVGVYSIVFQVPQNAPAGNNNVPFAIGVYYTQNSQLQLVFGNPTVIPIQ